MTSAARASFVLLLSLTGCPGAGNGAAEVSPPFPAGFNPGEALGEPPAPDPEAPGMAYLEKLYPSLRDGWGGFLEDCRLRLPPGDPLNDPKLVTRLSIVLDGAGKLVERTVLESSGNPTFDQTALEIVKEIALWPEPPAELVSDDDQVHLEWQFARDVRQAGLATAAVKRVDWPVDRAVPKLVAAGRITSAALRLAGEADKLTGDGSAADALAALVRVVAVAQVRHDLGSSDTATQLAAVAAAGAGKLGEVAAELRTLGQGAVDPGLRQAAVLALGKVGDVESTALLEGLAESTTATGLERAGAAAEALVLLGKTEGLAKVAVDRLASKDETARWSALGILSHLAAPAAVPSLIALLGSGSRAERLAAAAALATAAGQGGTALKALGDGLTAGDAAVRAACAQALAQVAASGGKSRAAYYKLVEMFKDKDEQVRAAAVLAAARLEPGKLSAELYTLAKEKSPVVEEALAEGLGGVPGADAMTRLGKLAGSKSPTVRLAAVHALAQRAEPKAAELLAGFAAQGEVSVRVAAVAGLRDRAVVAGLLTDEVVAVRAAALAKLVALDGKAKTMGQTLHLVADADGEGPLRCLVLAAWLGAR